MNLRRQIERRLFEIGLKGEMLVQFSPEVSDLIAGRGVLVVQRREFCDALMAENVWFCERYSIAELFAKEIR